MATAQLSSPASVTPRTVPPRVLPTPAVTVTFVVSWERHRRFEPGADVERLTRVTLADGSSTLFSDALEGLLNALLKEWRAHGSRPGFLELALASANRTVDEAHRLFGTLILRADHKGAEVRACELFNNFVYTVTTLVEAISAPATASSHRLAAGAVDVSVSVVCDRSLGGLIRHRATDSTRDHALEHYQPMRGADRTGAEVDFEPGPAHIRQVFRFTPDEIERRISRALAVIRSSLECLHGK